MFDDNPSHYNKDIKRKEREISLLLSKSYLDVLRLKYPKIVVDFYI